MADIEPRDARKLAAGVAAIAAVAIGVVTVFGERAHPPAKRPVVEKPAATRTSPAPGTVTAAPAAAPVPPAPSGGVLDRTALLAATAAAASAYGAGAGPPPEVQALTGRRFAVAIPFGCDGPAERNAAMGWSEGPGGDTLRVSVRREDWTASPFAEALGGPAVEAVEGFWLPRPWVRDDRCPGRPVDRLVAEPPTASSQTVGLANVYARGSSRVSRRGDRPYEVTLPLDEAGRPDERGLLLIVEGRVTPFVAGQTVRCQSGGPDQRPVCLIGAVIERVAIRNPAANTLLGEWRDAAPLTPAPAPEAERAGN